MLKYKMEIDNAFLTEVKGLVTQYKEFKELELEGRYTGHTSRLEFDRCVEYCQGISDYEQEMHEDVLDISADSYRISILGKSQITAYCKTNVVPADAIVIKKAPVAKPVQFELVDFKINLKREQPENDVTDLLEKLHTLDKIFRYKKRISFVNAKEGLRVDLTIVKSSVTAAKTFLNSGTASKPESYEIEVECTLRQKEILHSFLNTMFNLYRAIVDEEYFCSKKEKQEVLDEYVKICFDTSQQQPKKLFIGPQPVTLERVNIVDNIKGNIHVLKDYTVTEKADGERHLLFVNKNGRTYFINNRMNIKFSGVTLKTIKNVILDGEFITTDILGRHIKHFAIFDAYYYDAKNIRDLPLVGEKNSRLSKVKEFLATSKNSFKEEEYDIYCKDFLFGPNIFEKAHEVLSKAKTAGFPYKIDGLIFTPMYNAVGAIYKDQPVEKHPSVWRATFKWKPSEDNTIDFCVKYAKGSYNNPTISFVNSQAHRTMELYVGYDPGSWDRVDARTFLEGNFTVRSGFVAKRFNPPNVIEKDISSCMWPFIDNACRCENGDIIEDDSIVEFKYDNSQAYKQEFLKWIPIRIRKDKTESYRKTKSLGGAVNDLGTALNVWRSIQYPVTHEMITGKDTNIIIPDSTDAYYNRIFQDRNLYASSEMMNFHNSIKSALINQYKGTSVVDLACGKGGDFRKFLSAGFTRLLGYDSNRDNIENPVDGAYKRLYTMQRGRSLKYVMLTYDLSSKIDIKSFENDNDKHVAQVIHGNVRDMKLHKYQDMARDKFDLVNCQFAIHYFFESETTLDNFLSNVDMYLKDDGYFIGTCLNGHAVKKELKQSKVLKGEKNGVLLWDITRKYEKEEGVNYGEEIEVFMESIGKTFKEYLVNLDILTKKLKQMGYTPVEQKSFKDYQDDKFNMDDSLKKYSHLNTTFVYKKNSLKKRILTKKLIG